MIGEACALGVHYIRHDVLEDERGHFARLWCERELTSLGFAFQPIQASLSATRSAGTLRGLHWQAQPFAETKVMQVLRGRICDVVAKVDAFGDEPRYVMRELGPGEGFYIPAGLAHGFLTLTDDVEMAYLMDQPYVPASVRGARYDDPVLAIAWPRPPQLVAEKDRLWSPLSS